jgi:hypothetical protein
VFVTSLAIPAAFPEHPAGLAGPMLFAAGFMGFTVTYTVVTVLAAAADPALRRQAIVTMGATIVPVSAALLTGVLVGGVAQLVLWLTAVVIEGVTVWLTSHGGAWRVPSATHYAERHQLVVTTTAYRWRMTGRLARAGVIAALPAVLCVPGLAALPVPAALLTVVVLCLIPARRREGITPAAGYSPPAPDAHPAR